MKKIVSLLVVLTIFVSCKEEKKQDSREEMKVIQEKKERDFNDFLVFENSLMSQNVEGATYNNIKFDKYGAVFRKSITSPTYIKIPFSDLILNDGFNVSFSFKTIDDDGKKPQSLIAFSDKISSASRVPFYVYFPANKVSGVYGKQLLWADKYDAQYGNSRAYYDSPQLKKDQFYFVSVNFDGASVKIYVNSELYASFEELTQHNFKFDHLVIGALVQGDSTSKPFAGNIHGLKIFSKPLSEAEIVGVFNKQPVLDVEY